MPDVAERPGVGPGESRRAAWFPRCGNPRCSTGWVHLWRRRRVPGFEGKWACSPACMEALLAAAVQREKSGAERTPMTWSHRIPIGLLLVEQGTITGAQLRAALGERQRRREAAGEQVRLGKWLIESGLLTEPALTLGLSAQWNCPAYSLREYRPEETASVLPRLLAEVAGAVPVRVAADRLVHLAFEGSLDRSVSYAVERATGLRVAAGIAGDQEFRRAQAQYLETPGPRAEFLEAANATVLARAMAGRIERDEPHEARLVRVHDFYWLRLWRKEHPAPGMAGAAEVEDLLCTLPGGAGETREAAEAAE